MAVSPSGSGLSKQTWAIIIIALLAVGSLAYFFGQQRASQPESIQSSTQSTQPTHPIPSGEPAAPGGNGTRGPGPKALADGTFDAQIYGPGGDLTSAEASAHDVPRRDPNDPFAIGPVDAPVVISEFSDFECPFCARFANETRQTLVEKYVDTGLVRFEWNDFPVNGEHAEAAAKAGRAAAYQGKFEEFTKAYYKASEGLRGHPGFEMDDYLKFAQEAGVKDLALFQQQATDGTYDQVIEDAKAYASALGITGTPGFLIGEEFVNGAQPTEVFIQVIEAQLRSNTSGK